MHPVLALIIANVIWGAAPPIFKYALTNIPPFTLAFLRFFFALFIFLPFIWKYDFRQLNVRDYLFIFLGTACTTTVNIAFFFLGLERAPSINMSIITLSSPLFIFLFAVLFLREKFHWKVMSGMVVACMGVTLIVLS